MNQILEIRRQQHEDGTVTMTIRWITPSGKHHVRSFRGTDEEIKAFKQRTLDQLTSDMPF